MTKTAIALAAVVFAAGALACADEESTTQPVALEFAATVSGEALSCSVMYSGLGSTGARAQLADARFFASQVELRNAAGEWVAVALDTTPWQRPEVALVDFEPACSDGGTADTNTTITGRAPIDTYDAVRFVVGVPFELNHNDSATSPPPLNLESMFWTWRGGYKFVKVDWLVEGGVIPRWNVHIGSTLCVSDADVRPPDAECGRPNASSVVITDFDPDQDRIEVDLAALVAGADLTANTVDSPPGCMSNPMEPNECAPVFGALGLEFSTGTCTSGCDAQSLFTRGLAP